mgnify:CR=1 FL=1
MQKRAGITEKISISINREDLQALRKRAKRLYGGNISAVVAELADDAKLLEGMSELVDCLGGPSLTAEDRTRIDRELQSGPRSKPKAKARATA